MVVGTLLPPVGAAFDFAFVASTLLLFATALTRAGVAQDRLVAQLRRQATIDPLTGLLTRRGFDEATVRAVSGGATALILVDVDRFKHINDTYGHAVGDDALAHIAGILSTRSRDADVIARLGGDELAVLMPGCTYDNAVGRAGSFVAAVRDIPLRLADGRTIALSISAGAAHAPSQADNPRTLYTAADAALYGAKRDGRGTVGRPTAP